MIILLKRIMYGNELVGYITNSHDNRYVYIDKDFAKRKPIYKNVQNVTI